MTLSVRSLSRFGYCGVVLVLFGCSATTSVDRQIRIDETPMYGGIDRSAIPELKAGDARFVSDVVAQFGSKEKAANHWVDVGYKFYRENKLGMAMRRFNQAWLLNPNNPEVYAGFASVMHDQGKNCEAMDMMDRALELETPTFQGIFPDAARITTLCAVHNRSLTENERQKLFERSDMLYKKAELAEPNKRYVYGSWATAYYWQGKYADAWSMIEKERAAGGMPNDKFISLLNDKMPRPVEKMKAAISSTSEK